ALGIPNTKHFHDITSIADAIACTYSCCICFGSMCAWLRAILTFFGLCATAAVYNKLRNHIRQEQFIGDDEEEFEDTEGNVLNKRVSYVFYLHAMLYNFVFTVSSSARRTRIWPAKDCCKMWNSLSLEKPSHQQVLT